MTEEEKKQLDIEAYKHWLEESLGHKHDVFNRSINNALLINGGAATALAGVVSAQFSDGYIYLLFALISACGCATGVYQAAVADLLRKRAMDAYRSASHPNDAKGRGLSDEASAKIACSFKLFASSIVFLTITGGLTLMFAPDVKFRDFLAVMNSPHQQSAESTKILPDGSK
jgi:hypothetical protein